jgi:starch synthase
MQMRVAFVSSEVNPFSKTGGLADVSEALPGALAALGVEPTIVSPWYRSVAETVARAAVHVEETRADAPIHVGDRSFPLVYRRAVHQGVTHVFVVADELYDRPSLYLDAQGRDYADNLTRFTLLSRAALEYFLHVDTATPDVFHANDWQTALVPIYLETAYRSSAVGKARSVFTIHNLGYQGIFGAHELSTTGLGWDVFNAEALEYYGNVNLMKGGIVFADALTTVSPTYAKEIQTPELGRGLDGVVLAHARKLSGILNGIDTLRWDPASDPDLPAHFDVVDPSGKDRCKAALQERVGLPIRPRAFLLGVIGRFDVQKGIQLILDAFPRLERLDVQLVLLGAGDATIAGRARELAAEQPERVAVVSGFNDPLAHLIEAGADAFLMPSAYEPCGLNQMYSQRYGTIPIVRATGGLRDTVSDYDAEKSRRGIASGFSFAEFDAERLADTIRRAAGVFFDAPRSWRQLMLSCMRIDHSWERTALEYVRLYQSLAESGRNAPRSPKQRRKATHQPTDKATSK